ncbi:MAG TPA: hypothetical protein VL354_05300 [Spirochaetia bacterium]|nr:hypothetical protein [Spirochaetia bacterium]
MRQILVAVFSCALVTTPGIRAEAQASGSSPSAQCSDPLEVVKAFYDSNEAGHFGASMSYLADDVAFSTWATGVNGRQMMLRHLNGKKAVREFLPQGRGLRWRLPDSPPDGPVYRENRVNVSGNEVKLMLEPDRKRPNGGLYNYFSIDAVVDGCRIKTLTVIEQITWL